MGASEILGVTVTGLAALRAFVLIAQEWIRAHRTKITLEIEGHGRLEVEGTTNVDRLLAVLERQAEGGGESA